MFICSNYFHWSCTIKTIEAEIRVYSHFLYISGQKVKSYENITLDEKAQVARLCVEVKARNKEISIETIQPNMSLPTQNIDVKSQKKGSTKGKKRAIFVARMFNMQS